MSSFMRPIGAAPSSKGSRCTSCGIFYRLVEDSCPKCGNQKPARDHRDWNPNRLPDVLKVLPLEPPTRAQKFRVRT